VATLLETERARGHAGRFGKREAQSLHVAERWSLSSEE
jgi:hypothetical protein